MTFRPSAVIEVKRIRGKGRGVFATQLIRPGSEIERVPVLVLRADDAQSQPLTRYCFLWGRGTVSLPLGYGALYNHSYTPNAECLDLAPQTKLFRALRTIKAGEEITINYNGQAGDRSDVGFPVH